MYNLTARNTPTIAQLMTQPSIVCLMEVGRLTLANENSYDSRKCTQSTSKTNTSQGKNELHFKNDDSIAFKVGWMTSCLEKRAIF